jgi:hypothetical protein
MVLDEVGRAVDQARDAHDALDLVEVADRGVQRAEQVDRDRARRLLAGRGVMSRPSWPTQALPSRLAMWPGEEDEVAAAHERNVGAGGNASGGSEMSSR